jgi:hypothetical protein
VFVEQQIWYREKGHLYFFPLILVAFPWGDAIPLNFLRLFLTISVTLKSAIIFVLPVSIFGLIFSTFQCLRQGASEIFAIALGLLCCSNFLAIYMSHFVGESVHSMDLALAQGAAGNELVPLFNFQFPKIISNAFAMICRAICGIFVLKVSRTYSQKILDAFDVVI